MFNWETQLESIGTALLMIEKLPDGTVWSLCCTNDDDPDSPSALNIFSPDEEFTEKLITLFKLGEAIDLEDDFISWRRGALHISIILQEPDNG